MPNEKNVYDTPLPRTRSFWKRLFRFDLGMLVCFILAVNFMAYVNWQLRDGYRVVVDTDNEKRVVLRPKYEVGWPWHFLKLNGIQKRVQTHTQADSEPIVEVMSWTDGALTLGVNFLLVCVLTILFVGLKSALFAERTRRAPARLSNKKIRPELM